MYAMRSTSKSMLILLGFMYCSTCRVLLLKWSSSGPRSQPDEESLTITSWNRHKQRYVYKDKTAQPHDVLLLQRACYLVL